MATKKGKALVELLFKNPGQIKSKLYDLSVDKTLKFYERWVLPQEWWHGHSETTRVSIKELKLREFRDRKKLLNPYQKE